MTSKICAAQEAEFALRGAAVRSAKPCVSLTLHARWRIIPASRIDRHIPAIL